MVAEPIRLNRTRIMERLIDEDIDGVVLPALAAHVRVRAREICN